MDCAQGAYDVRVLATRHLLEFISDKADLVLVVRQ